MWSWWAPKRFVDACATVWDVGASAPCHVLAAPAKRSPSSQAPASARCACEPRSVNAAWRAGGAVARANARELGGRARAWSRRRRRRSYLRRRGSCPPRTRRGRRPRTEVSELLPPRFSARDLLRSERQARAALETRRRRRDRLAAELDGQEGVLARRRRRPARAREARSRLRPGAAEIKGSARWRRPTDGWGMDQVAPLNRQCSASEGSRATSTSQPISATPSAGGSRCTRQAATARRALGSCEAPRPRGDVDAGGQYVQLLPSAAPDGGLLAPRQARSPLRAKRSSRFWPRHIDARRRRGRRRESADDAGRARATAIIIYVQKLAAAVRAASARERTRCRGALRAHVDRGDTSRRAALIRLDGT